MTAFIKELEQKMVDFTKLVAEIVGMSSACGCDEQKIIMLLIQRLEGIRFLGAIEKSKIFEVNND